MSRQIRFEEPNVPVFSKSDSTFPTMLTNIVNSPQWWKISTGAGKTSTSH